MPYYFPWRRKKKRTSLLWTWETVDSDIRVTVRQEVKIEKKDGLKRILKKMLDLEIIPEKAVTTDNWEIV